MNKGDEYGIERSTRYSRGDYEKNIREYICDKLDISEDTMIEAWYRISRRDE